MIERWSRGPFLKGRSSPGPDGRPGPVAEEDEEEDGDLWETPQALDLQRNTPTNPPKMAPGHPATNHPTASPTGTMTTEGTLGPPPPGDPFGLTGRPPHAPEECRRDTWY